MIVRLGVVIIVGFFSWVFVSSRNSVAAALAFLTLWTFFWIFYRAQTLLTVLYKSDDLFQFSFLPVEKPMVFRWELQKFYRASVLSLLDLIAGYGTIAVCLHSPAAIAATLPAAVLGWAVMHALAMFCASRWPQFPYGLVFIGAFFSLFILRFGDLGARFADALHSFAIPINVLLPSGWASCLFLFFAGNHEWTFALLIIPIVGVLCTIPNSLARLQAGYKFSEITRPEASDILPEDSEEIAFVADEPDKNVLRVDSDAIEQVVRKHLVLPPVQWCETAWPETMLWRWLNPRERILAEFVFPRKIAILGPWIKCFRNAAFTVLFALANGLLLQKLESLTIIGGLGLIWLVALMRIMYSGRAFRPVQSSGVNLPFYACYGIGLRELSRLLLKYTLIQIPLLLLFSLLCGGLVAHFAFSLPVSIGLLFSLKITGLVAAMRCVFVTLSFSSGSNDSSRFRLRNIALGISMLLVIASFFVCGAIALFVPDAIASWTLWLLAIAIACLVPGIYSWFYNRNWFDLMSLPKR